MPACDEGGGVQAEQAAFRALCLCHPPSQARGPKQKQRGQTRSWALKSLLLLLQSICSNGEVAICQRLVVPVGTALNKTKQHEEAATRQHWLLAQRFHVPLWSHKLMCSCGSEIM